MVYSEIVLEVQLWQRRPLTLLRQLLPGDGLYRRWNRLVLLPVYDDMVVIDCIGHCSTVLGRFQTVAVHDTAAVGRVLDDVGVVAGIVVTVVVVDAVASGFDVLDCLEVMLVSGDGNVAVVRRGRFHDRFELVEVFR